MSDRLYAASTALIALALLPGAAAAADILIPMPRIAGGRLVITGTTDKPNTGVRR